MSDSPYRGSDSCDTCIKLARELGELRAASSTHKRRTYFQVLEASAMIGGVLGCMLFLSTLIYAAIMRPEPCKDSAEVVHRTDWEFRCSPGATLSTSDAPGKDGLLVVKCTCPDSIRTDVTDAGGSE